MHSTFDFAVDIFPDTVAFCRLKLNWLVEQISYAEKRGTEMFSFHQQSCSTSGSITFHYYYYWLQKHLSVVESVT